MAADIQIRRVPATPDAEPPPHHPPQHPQHTPHHTPQHHNQPAAGKVAVSRLMARAAKQARAVPVSVEQGHGRQDDKDMLVVGVVWGMTSVLLTWCQEKKLCR